MNRLGSETSPYLLQHAGNPVHWRPWDDEALAEARELGRPIFLSVGYSSCHWCHVMAHESFEDASIAEFMNGHFVNIKVDREERPDIDDIYQRACMAATGQGGWPLSAFLTPDLRPFFVGTYFPPLDSHGRPGFGSLCRRMSQAWREDPAGVEGAAKRFVERLRDEAPRPEEADGVLLDEAASGLLRLGDAVHGGFGSAPKFPSSGCLSFLIWYSKISGAKAPAEFALKSLRMMSRGGIFDHVGGGFHRYSTDARWLVPHFEKMLYDNALIPASLLEAHQYSGDARHLDAALRTIRFVMREMSSPEGGYYSAIDADSGDGEGSYYTWDARAVRPLLGGDADLFCMHYGVTDGGNWEGRTILSESPGAARRLGIGEEEAERRLAGCRRILLEERGSRPRPGTDTKILASWNALFISALARAHRATGDAAYLGAAEKCARFVHGMRDRGGLLHTYKDGRASVPGYLEDHAFLANAMLDVFEERPSAWLLEGALELGGTVASEFWDGSRFYMTSGRHEQMIMRPPSVHDLSVPSGAAEAVRALTRLHRLAHRPDLDGVAARAASGMARQAAENPFAHAAMLCAIAGRLQDPGSILVLNTSDAAVVGLVRSAYVPGRAAVFADSLDGLAKYPLFAGKEVGPSTEVISCTGQSCSAPARGAAEVSAMLARS